MKALFTFGLGVLITMQSISCRNARPSGATPGIDTVVINNMQFTPAVLWANRGDTIVWINKDMVSHDVTSLPDKQWTSDTIASGESWKAIAGVTTEYMCSIHPTMKGKIQLRE